MGRGLFVRNGTIWISPRIPSPHALPSFVTCHVIVGDFGSNRSARPTSPGGTKDGSPGRKPGVDGIEETHLAPVGAKDRAAYWKRAPTHDGDHERRGAPARASLDASAHFFRPYRGCARGGSADPGLTPWATIYRPDGAAIFRKGDTVRNEDVSVKTAGRHTQACIWIRTHRNTNAGSGSRIHPYGAHVLPRRSS